MSASRHILTKRNSMYCAQSILESIFLQSEWQEGKCESRKFNFQMHKHLDKRRFPREQRCHRDNFIKDITKEWVHDLWVFSIWRLACPFQCQSKSHRILKTKWRGLVQVLSTGSLLASVCIVTGIQPTNALRTQAGCGNGLGPDISVSKMLPLKPQEPEFDHQI